MTDRVQTLIVTFEGRVRDDDAEDIAKLIRSIRHVADVRLGPVSDLSDVYAERVRMAQKLRRLCFDWADQLKDGGE